MVWIKDNYERFLVALFAAILLGCAGFLLLSARTFNDVFATLEEPVTHNNTVPPVQKDRDVVLAEQAKLTQPDLWSPRMMGNRRLPLFVSLPYISRTETDANGATKEQLIDPMEDNHVMHPPVPNTWLINNKQDLLAPDVLSQDTDGDGFTTLEEYEAHTDPSNKDSHPPYWTKLFLKRFYRIPFRLRYDARNGDTYQINTLDLDEPTQFLKVNDMVKGTKFKVTKFTDKHAVQEGINKDVSEVTLTNIDSGDTIVLVKQEEVDSPTTYAILAYLWTNREFAVKKNQEFTLQPEDKVKYKCLGLTDTEVIVLKEDENKTLRITQLQANK